VGRGGRKEATDSWVKRVCLHEGCGANEAQTQDRDIYHGELDHCWGDEQAGRTIRGGKEELILSERKIEVSRKEEAWKKGFRSLKLLS